MFIAVIYVNLINSANIVDIIIAGDFNFNMALHSDNKITELMNEFHLKLYHT